MNKPTINVRCEAAVNINLADLTQLQGDLKELSEGNFNKLKTSILKHGITFPFFVWQNQSVNYILDGTQRDRVLKRMIEEGYQVPAATMRTHPSQRSEGSRRENPADLQSVWPHDGRKSQ